MGIYDIMFYGGLILAAIFLIASIVIFFVMRIPDAFGVVTGRTQKKAIEEIRAGGHAATANKKKRRSGNIQARDIDVSETRKKSSNTESPVKQSSMKDSTSSDDIARKAAEDAKRTAESAAEKARRNLEEESTEVLTYNEMKNKADASEDPTSVLEMEKATDILSQAEEYYEEGSHEDYDDDADAATDVLTSRDAKEEGKERPESYDESGDETTDVLRSTSSTVTGMNMYDDDLDEEADKTDVLTAEMSGLSDKDVYGTYNPETTSVLKSDMAPGNDSVKQGGGLDQPGITVIYSETVVHTDESL